MGTGPWGRPGLSTPGRQPATKLERNEEERLEHQNFLQTIIDGVNDGLMVINRDYTIAYANKAALDIHKKQGVEPATTCYQLSHSQNYPCTGLEHICPLKKL